MVGYNMIPVPIWRRISFASKNSHIIHIKKSIHKGGIFSMSLYVGVNGSPKKVNKLLVGVNGAAKEVKTGYTGGSIQA